MEKINLALANRIREVAAEPVIVLKNRYPEQNPVLTEGVNTLISRPALRYWQQVGDGPIRGMASQPGAFDDDIFIASGGNLYRVSRDPDAAPTLIWSDLAGAAQNSNIPMCFTGDVGSITPKLWFCDGTGVFTYSETSNAKNTLSVTGAISAGEQVVIDGVYYQFTSGSVDTGTPAGTSGAPWLVLLEANVAASITNLYNAINATDSTAGTKYSTATTPHPTVFASEATVNSLVVTAISAGLAGAGLSCTETGVNMAWSDATTQGGTTPGVIQVPTPDDIGIVSVVMLNSYVICVVAQGAGVNGRFYWVEPGEVQIDPLNYATAERSADAINQAKVFNDQFWLMGQDSTEVWYTTGDPNAPMARVQGYVFDRGVYMGTAQQVDSSIIFVDNSGGVFIFSGKEQRVSTPDIEERIRKSIALTNLRTSLLGGF